jgi:hypothetical protein
MSFFFWPLCCMSFFFWPLCCMSFFFWPLCCMSFFDLQTLIALWYLQTFHVTIYYTTWRHLKKKKSWTIISLFCVPLEFQPKMKNWNCRHSIGFLNYTSVLTNSVILLGRKFSFSGFPPLSVIVLDRIHKNLKLCFQFINLGSRYFNPLANS